MSAVSQSGKSIRKIAEQSTRISFVRTKNSIGGDEEPFTPGKALMSDVDEYLRINYNVSPIRFDPRSRAVLDKAKSATNG